MSLGAPHRKSGEDEQNPTIKIALHGIDFCGFIVKNDFVSCFYEEEATKVNNFWSSFEMQIPAHRLDSFLFSISGTKF